MDQRASQILRASMVNIVSNFALAACKGIIGLIVGSIAITLDAVNNFTDAISSIITIIGTKLAEKPADREHPFGYGRMEYIAAIAIAALIISAGVTSTIESAQRLANPETPEYTAHSLVIVGIACVAKMLLGTYLRRTGKRIGAGALVASGTEALMDSIVSAATIASALIFITTGISTEAWLATIIAIMIVKSGLELLGEQISKVLGERVEPQTVSAVEASARSVDGVKLASGIVVQDIGPNRLNGSLHLTVDGQMSVAEFNGIAREVRKRVSDECGVELLCIGAYPASTGDDAARTIRSTIGRILWSHKDVVEVRGIYVDTEKQHARFDAVVGLGTENPQKVHEMLVALCKVACPDWTIDAHILPDVGD